MEPLVYIGPGPGLAVQAPLLVFLLALAVALFGFLSFPFRWLARRGWRPRPTKCRRVVVLGLDGLEPTQVERLIAEGRLPNLQSLQDEGSYQTLGTTCPPLSPVAWSSFSTGVNPGKHGIFGFVERDSGYRLRLTSATVERGPARFLNWNLPWKTERPIFRRKSISFWKLLGQAGVLTHVLRVPISWPPEPFQGFLLSAMGAPDLMGTQGTYTLFSSQPRTLGHGQFSPLSQDGNDWCAEIAGPKGRSLPLRLTTEGLTIAKTRHSLKSGQTTPWIRLDFGRCTGLAQFHRIDETTLTMSALQIDPARPTTPISWPPLFASTLEKLCGPYATCGLAEDTGAREDGVLSEQAFLDHAYSIHQERERQFFHLLRRTPHGCLVAVFDGSDRIAHMFSAPSQLQTLDEMVARMDDLVGRTRQQIGPDDVLIVLSDHGFKPLHTLVDINAWLAQHGYLQAKEGAVDWSDSRAGVYNLSGVRLNLRGRESQGMVDKDQAAELKNEIRDGLKSLEWQGEKVFTDVFLADEIYTGPYLERAPDLVLGFSPGFGIFKDSTRGFVSSEIFHANSSTWSGDHCYHPDTIPGVLFCNRKLNPGAQITDLSATILDLQGVERPPWMEGKSLLPQGDALPTSIGGETVES